MLPVDIVKLVPSLAPLTQEGGVCVGAADTEVDIVEVAVNRLLEDDPVTVTVPEFAKDVTLLTEEVDPEVARLPLLERLAKLEIEEP